MSNKIMPFLLATSALLYDKFKGSWSPKGFSYQQSYYEQTSSFLKKKKKKGKR